MYGKRTHGSVRAKKVGLIIRLSSYSILFYVNNGMVLAKLFCNGIFIQLLEMGYCDDEFDFGDAIAGNNRNDLLLLRKVSFAAKKGI